MTTTEQIISEVTNGYGWHNPAALFRTAPSELGRQVKLHYSQRGLGQIPPSVNSGLIVEELTPIAKKQIQYLSAVIGRTININTLDNAPKGSLIVPYVNTPETAKSIVESGHQVLGLPAELVAIAKNKADCHIELAKANIPNFNVPEFKISEPKDISTTSTKLLQESENLYVKTGMAGIYPMGVFIRGANSDGNYGAMMVKQFSPSEIVCTPNGDTSKNVVFPDWASALAFAQNHFPEASPGDPADRRVVISRYMDIASSPGLSIYISDGEYHSLGWNGQVQEPGSTACVGTSTFQAKTDIERMFQDQLEELSAQNLFKFTNHLCHKVGLSIQNVKGFENTDLMLPGPLEIELQKRRGQNPHIYVAEINPRYTNWSEADQQAVVISNMAITISNMISVISKGLLTADNLPVDITPQRLERIHETVFELDQKEQRLGNRVVVRMATAPRAGFIFMGNTAQAKEDTIQALNAI